MAEHSKAYRKAAELIDPERTYSPLEAAGVVTKTSPTKFDATVEVAMRLGVDPRKADQMVRGTVSLPHGTGKTARVIVFAAGEQAAAAEAAGADRVGSDDLVAEIQGGFLDFDAAIATPDQMARWAASPASSARAASCPTRKRAPSRRTWPRRSPTSRAARSRSASTSRPICT
jgi:large subunit ribosomal protein L1